MVCMLIYPFIMNLHSVKIEELMCLELVIVKKLK